MSIKPSLVGAGYMTGVRRIVGVTGQRETNDAIWPYFLALMMKEVVLRGAKGATLCFSFLA